MSPCPADLQGLCLLKSLLTSVSEMERSTVEEPIGQARFFNGALDFTTVRFAGNFFCITRLLVVKEYFYTLLLLL